jgi:GH15 family glucan-1,4-alpha-glucosidase
MDLHALAQVTTTASATEAHAYRPISEYGVIGDCRTAALVAPDGSIDWCCLPHFDSPAIFCRLLDARIGGFFRVGPTAEFRAEMSYMDTTNVLQTMYTTTSGRLRVVDFMPIRKRQQPGSLIQRIAASVPGRPHGLQAGLERELGNDVAAAHRINRIVSCLEGAVEVEVALKATFDFARAEAQVRAEPIGDGGVGAVFSAGGRHLVLALRYIGTIPEQALAEPMRLEAREGAQVARLTLRSGQRLVAALNYARDEAEAARMLRELNQHDFDADLDETMGYWRGWAAAAEYDGPYQQIVQRSALALKLCIFEPTGAIVAAPTTSLPECLSGVRNWDYRYTWLRDSAFTLGALGQLGYHEEARDYFHFLHDLHVRDVDDLRIMYGIRGEQSDELAEQSLDHLEGYRGSRPVRVGNGAAMQHQLDVYGEVIDAAYSYIRNEGFRPAHRRVESNRDLRALTRHIADYVVEHWQENDHGIWEIRGKPRAFVYSRAMCWLALERACMVAEEHGHKRQLARWDQVRDAIHQDVLAHGYSEHLRSFTQAYDDVHLDAANLRLALVRFLDSEDERMRGTIEVTGQKLAGPNHLLYRYEPMSVKPGDDKALIEHEVDGLRGSEGAFLACTFWHVSTLCQIGQLDEARRLFEELIGYASPLGLYSEEIDPSTGELLGNYPQAFTHIGLINSAATLLSAQEGRLNLQPDQTTRG